jgi:ABC-type transport system involved in cytochrome c biogenesis permease subunit
MSKTMTHPEPVQLNRATGNTVIALVGLAVVFLLINALLAVARGGEILTEQNLLFVALVFYGASAAMYLAYALNGAEHHIRVATLATLAGWAATSFAAGHRWYVSGHAPFSSIYEMLLSFTWTLAALTLWMGWRYRARLVGTVTMPLAVLGVVLMQLLPSEVRPLVPALQSTWLHVHVTLAMLAYAACAVSFALALMFLIKDHVTTDTFIVSTSVLGAAIFGAILTRFGASLGLRVTAWDPVGGREIFIAEHTPLTVVIPGLGGIFLAVMVASLMPAVFNILGRKKQISGLSKWSSRAMFLALLLQGVALTAFLVLGRGGVYASPQAEGSFTTNLAASPFIVAGLGGAVLISLMCLLLVWRREGLESMMPSAGDLDRLTYKTIGIAFPLLTLMIAAGAYWANRTWGSYWSWDPKETWALITWLVYAGYLHMRITRGWRGRRAAYFAILGFAVVMFTFFGVTYLLPGLHAYA